MESVEKVVRCFVMYSPSSKPNIRYKNYNQFGRNLHSNSIQVIKSPDKNDVELELYPLTLRILRHQAQTSVSNRMAYPQSNSWSGMAGGYGAAALSKYLRINYSFYWPKEKF